MRRYNHFQQKSNINILSVVGEKKRMVRVKMLFKLPIFVNLSQTNGKVNILMHLFLTILYELYALRTLIQIRINEPGTI